MRQQFWLSRVSPRLWIQDENNLSNPQALPLWPMVQTPFRKGKFWKLTPALFVDQSSHYNYITLSVVSTTAPTMIRDVAKILSKTETTVPALVRDMTKVLSKTETAVPTMVRSVTKYLAVTETTSPSITRSLAKLLAVLETTSPSVVRAVVKYLAVTETTSPKVARSVTKLLTALETTNPSMQRAVTKILSVLETDNVSLDAVGPPVVVHPSGGSVVRLRKTKTRRPAFLDGAFDSEDRAIEKALQAKWLRDNIDDEELLAILLSILEGED